MFISRPCDSAHGKGQIPVERRGSGGSHPTPIPGVDPQLLAGDFPCTKPRKAFPGFFFFWDAPHSSQPNLSSRVGMAEIQKPAPSPRRREEFGLSAGEE